MAQPSLTVEGAVELVERLIDEFDVVNIASARRLIAVFSQQGRTVSGYPRLRPADCARVTEALTRAVAANQEYIRMADSSVVDRLNELIATYYETDISFYPAEELKVILLQAQVSLLAGNHEVALQLTRAPADKPYSVEGGFETMIQLFTLDAQGRLMTGRSNDLGLVTLVRVLHMLRVRPFWAWSHARRFAQYLGVGRSARIRDGVLAYLVGVHSRALTRMRMRRNRGLMGLIMVIGPLTAFHVTLSGTWLFLMRYGDLRWGQSRSKAPQARDIVVTRAMGGIGDLLMMTPGLRSLSKKYGRPVKFATQKKFFPIFRNNPYVELLDIDGPPIDPLTARRWFNLTVCPASAYEVRVAPFIKKGRVETFAKGMGISRRRLWVDGWQPTVELDDDQAEFCRQFVAKGNLGAGGRLVIGVQPFSRDSYKDYNQVHELVHALAAQYNVLLFHHTPEGLPSGDHIFSTANLPLHYSLALTSVLDGMVSVDSAFLHAAAAFDVPVVGLFGPTDGKTLTRHHRHARVIMNKRSFRCSPCWRNEDSPCALTGIAGLSPCISSITVAEIQAALAQLLQEAERRGRKRRAAPRLEVSSIA